MTNQQIVRGWLIAQLIGGVISVVIMAVLTKKVSLPD